MLCHLSQDQIFRYAPHSCRCPQSQQVEQPAAQAAFHPAALLRQIARSLPLHLMQRHFCNLRPEIQHRPFKIYTVRLIYSRP